MVYRMAMRVLAGCLATMGIVRAQGLPKEGQGMRVFKLPQGKLRVEFTKFDPWDKYQDGGLASWIYEHMETQYPRPGHAPGDPPAGTWTPPAWRSISGPAPNN